MAAIKQLLQHDGGASQYASTDTDSACNSDTEGSTSSNRKIGSVKIDRQDRQPTRRPNPNVQNRNALLARENRRRKKEHMEAMEKELADMRMKNKHMRKALKQQMKAIGQLQNEKRYYQSVIANHKEIENLIKALNVRMHVQQLSSSTTSAANSPMLSVSSPTNIFQNLDALDDEYDGCKGANNTTLISATSTSEQSDNDFESLSPTTFAGTWADLLDEGFGTADMNQLTNSAKVVDEHSYADIIGLNPSSSSSASTDIDVDAGICLHIRQGKVSLEYCPYCSSNSSEHTTLNSF